ncbi:type II CAAX prenyl endopeptidase Rce1 family protein [Thiohalorhabdus sp. Cl-TMA]|uniref:Type II CAAX prenyl endopeptidase Rce1 family protein n=1 Tax=Thiohalorhabdus methylotrophus TaxID=3242694 RepID=A0ABV4TR50_9GAMM
MPVRQWPVVAFFLFAFGWTWLFWGTAAAARGLLSGAEVAVLIAVGGLGPALAAGVRLAREGPAARRDFLRRLVDPHRVPGPFWAAALGIPPATALAALLVDQGLPGARGAAPAAWLGEPASLTIMTGYLLVFGPLPEEPGWRGYALERLQERLPALGAALLLGALWALWHLPLFLIPGTYQEAVIGLGTIRFWGDFVPVLLALSVLMAWVYNHTGGSVLAAIVFHFAANFTGEALGLGPRQALLQASFLLLVTGVVVLVAGPSGLGGGHTRSELRPGRPFRTQPGP